MQNQSCGYFWGCAIMLFSKYSVKHASKMEAKSPRVYFWVRASLWTNSPAEKCRRCESIDISITARSNWLPVKSVGRDLFGRICFVYLFCINNAVRLQKNIPIFWTSAAQPRMKSSLVSGCPQRLEAVARHIYNLTRFTSSAESLIKPQHTLFITAQKVRRDVCW